MSTLSNPTMHKPVLLPSLSSPSPLYRYPPRALLLFTLGFIFSVIIDHLQKEHDIIQYPNNVSQLFSSASWVPISCGLSGCLIGTLYPVMDYWWLETPHMLNREWSSVLRCCGGFIGQFCNSCLNVNDASFDDMHS